MLRPRLIVFLLLHNGGLYKTVNFKTPIYIGDPLNVVKIFNDFFVDELFLVDIDATTKDTLPNYDLIANISSVSRMPLCYGGGIKSLQQIEKIISLGVEKISISSAALESSKLIEEGSDMFGSQSIVGCIDIKNSDSTKKYSVYTHNGSKKLEAGLFDIIQKLTNSGIGEIVINSIDRDGTYLGYDIPIIKEVVNNSTVPITVLGGAGSNKDIKELIEISGINGVAAGSLWSFKGSLKAVLPNYPDPIMKNKILNFWLIELFLIIT